MPDGMTHEYYFSILKEAFKIQDADTKRFNYAIARHQIIKTDAIVRPLFSFFACVTLN